MSSLFSASWYRVATLKPRLRDHIEVHRHPYGDELAYVLQDHSSGKLHRFNASAYDIIGRMNGRRTLDEIWGAAVETLGDDAPTQDETIGLLGRLHGIDALQGSVTPDSAELFDRAARDRSRAWKRRLQSPLSLRLPLLDPDRVLTRLLPVLGPIFSGLGFALWCVVVIAALLLAALNWPELAYTAREQALAPMNLLMLACIYPFLKALHELGHALTTKKWGGEVHEMGITLMVFMPIPYVDASSAAVIRNKYQRMGVGAAGMLVELGLASAALFLWIAIEPGVLRDAAFNIMLIGGVTTVLFNGNPLLRFDAYYILEDAIEVPNLASRSSRFLGYLIQRYLFGVRGAVNPATRPGERAWLAFYGLLSGPYKLFISITIVWFVAGEFFVVGVLLAIWAGTVQLLVPIAKHLWFVLFDTRLRERRLRAMFVSGGVVCLVGALCASYPVPSATHAEGVLWLPERSHLQAGTEGFVNARLVEPLSRVKKGDTIFELADPFLSARIAVLEAEREELSARQRIEVRTDPVKATLYEEQIASKDAELVRERERATQLRVVSPFDGIFVPPDLADPIGRYVRQGSTVGYVMERQSLTVRAVVPQSDIGRVREGVDRVDVQLAERIGQPIAASIVRAIPAAQTQLPSKALTVAGGGPFLVDPSDDSGLVVREAVFLFELDLSQPPDTWRIGERVHVRFEHAKRPLAEQWLHLGRQLFLGRFGV